jgi:DNA primase
MLNKRLVIPFTFRNNIVGFTGRFAGTPPNEQITKYYNISPSDFIYNLDRQKPQNDYVILCEGVLDAYSVNGLSAQGNEINESQVAYIKSLNKTVIVLPDFDKDGSALLNVAVKNNWAVSFPFWSTEIKDAASAVEKYGRVVTMMSILEAADYSTFSAQVKWRMKH